MEAGAKKKLKRCPKCGYGPLREETITDHFEYRPDGEEPLTIEVQDVPVEVCPNCSEKYLGPKAARIQHEAVCQKLGLLTPAKIQPIREH